MASVSDLRSETDFLQAFLHRQKAQREELLGCSSPDELQVQPEAVKELAASLQEFLEVAEKFQQRYNAVRFLQQKQQHKTRKFRDQAVNNTIHRISEKTPQSEVNQLELMHAILTACLSDFFAVLCPLEVDLGVLCLCTTTLMCRHYAASPTWVEPASDDGLLTVCAGTEILE